MYEIVVKGRVYASHHSRQWAMQMVSALAVRGIACKVLYVQRGKLPVEV